MSISRRSFLAGSVAAGSIALIAACSSGSGGDSYSGPPRRGGVLRIGAIGQASGLTVNPYTLIANDSDMLLMSLLLDPLTVPNVAENASSNVGARLASAWEADAEQRVWTFTIAENAVFHDGSPVTSADVVWSLKALRSAPNGDWKVPVPLDAITAVDDRRVRLVSETPNSQLPLLLRLMTFVMKAGSPTDITKATGSGPFVLESYDDGNARLRRHDKWYGGAPMLDGIEITRFASSQALATAVAAGQIDLASNVGALAARTAASRSDLTVVRRPDDLAVCLALRTSDGPFADPRVREAIRLGVDRLAMVKQVFSDYGTIGNDVLGVGDPAYDRTLTQRTRDVARAEQLLSDAKFDTAATYRCFTKEEAIGEVDSARLIATQLGDIGVKVEVVVQDPTAFYDESWVKPAAPMTTVSWATNDSLMFYASKVLRSDTTANETAFRDAEFDAAYKKTLATPNGPAQQESLKAVQRIQYDRGGYVVWGTADGIDIASSKVRDAPTASGYGRVQLERTWMTP
ncbi:ABC transporter substrate-binding protein [Nocardia fluminea]|uniref:Peptide/nickel transport system substrate-binding protein n=1 Tax=Nocardia fluminea TaxID=134984 RepID=A0A2N3WW01_9NOCA|nr:ABC transporter substrate-binding protein [Nocardia fluminea]PKV98028.1 peptide/nickel transport system substrate-binding protein [Nocardia fluminea]